MTYEYGRFRHVVFTDEGQRMLLKIRDHVRDVIAKAGVITIQKAIEGAGGGDCWHMLACIDRLCELGELEKFQSPYRPTQEHFLVPKGGAK